MHIRTPLEWLFGQADTLTEVGAAPAAELPDGGSPPEAGGP